MLTELRRQSIETQALTELCDWSSLVGFAEDLSRFRRMQEQGRVPPVILFSGREGIGKASFALRVASSFFCRNGHGCASCPACEEIRHQEHPDVMVIAPEAGRLKTGEVAQARDFLNLRPCREAAGNPQGVKVLVMTDIDLMTIAAANRMLKTLEEPPETSVILMTSGRKKALLPTILSRAIDWPLSPPSTEESIRAIRLRLSETEQEQYSDDRLKELLDRKGQAPGRVMTSLANEGQRRADQVALLRTALHSGKAGQLLDVCRAIAGEWRWSAAELLEETEQLLSQIYQSPAASELSFGMIRKRRMRLRALKRLVMQDRTSVNVRLMAEAIFLTDNTR